MPQIKPLLTRLLADESGVSSVEYAMLLAFVASAVMLAAGELANSVSGRMSDSAACISSAGASC